MDNQNPIQPRYNVTPSSRSTRPIRSVDGLSRPVNRAIYNRPVRTKLASTPLQPTGSQLPARPPVPSINDITAVTPAVSQAQSFSQSVSNPVQAQPNRPADTTLPMQNVPPQPVIPSPAEPVHLPPEPLTSYTPQPLPVMTNPLPSQYQPAINTASTPNLIETSAIVNSTAAAMPQSVPMTAAADKLIPVQPKYPSLSGMPTAEILDRPVNQDEPAVTNRFAAPSDLSRRAASSKQAKLFSVATLIASIIVLISWLAFTRLPGISSPAFLIGIVLVILQAAIAAGLLFNFKLSPKLYKGAAAAFFIFSVFSVGAYIVGLHNLNNSAKEEIAVYKSQIGQYEAMSTLPASQRASIVRVIEGYESQIPSKTAKQKGTPLPLLTDFLLAGTVIFFLSRPQLKQELSQAKQLAI
ncbi:MAG TPA: hypothetical protein VFN51_01415 [Candidatus Saccharimonadales bacterium]|nr:hypothetical protein [Candidatus Saccharimonadales bacterium]